MIVGRGLSGEGEGQTLGFGDQSLERGGANEFSK